MLNNKRYYPTYDNMQKLWSALGYIQKNSGGTPSILTFENGLYINDNIVKLGLDLSTVGTTNQGLLTEDTLLVRGDIFTINSSVTIAEQTVGMVSTTIDGDKYALSASSTSASIGKVTGGGSPLQILNFTIEGNIILTDSINSKGLEYLEDYSANFTDRSLVDKAYVDAAIAAALAP